MLVLSRKPGETLKIGDDIEITIVEVKGELVRMGIDAPRDVQVWRKELWESIVEENRKAAAEAASIAVDLPLIPGGKLPGDLPVVKKPSPVKMANLLVKKKDKEDK